jgi:hypothetical protein
MINNPASISLVSVQLCHSNDSLTQRLVKRPAVRHFVKPRFAPTEIRAHHEHVARHDEPTEKDNKRIRVDEWNHSHVNERQAATRISADLGKSQASCSEDSDT